MLASLVFRVLPRHELWSRSRSVDTIVIKSIRHAETWAGGVKATDERQ